MILEALTENKILGQLSAIPELSGYQFMTSRQTVSEGETLVENDDKDGLVVIATMFRRNNAFSLPTIDVPVDITVATRMELDPTAAKHEAAVETIADRLSFWHKKPNLMREAFSTEKFMVGELYMDGGSGRTADKTERCWRDSFDFSLRGSEIFTAPQL